MSAAPLKREVLSEFMEKASLLVNTTSVGMGGKGRLDLPLEKLPHKAVVSDIVYSPVKTELLKDAERLGYRILDGIGMLVEQGVFSFKIWTGFDAPRESMEKALLDVINKNSGSGL